MRRDKFSSFAIILSYRKTEFGSYKDTPVACIFYRTPRIPAFVCANPLASSFSPCRRDLHAKVRVEILIGHAALCKSMCTPAGTGRATERERGREKDGASGRTQGEIIHYVLGHNVAHLKQWQMRENGRIICKNGILPVPVVDGRWYAYRMNVGTANIGHKAGNNCDSLYGLA